MDVSRSPPELAKHMISSDQEIDYVKIGDLLIDTSQLTPTQAISSDDADTYFLKKLYERTGTIEVCTEVNSLEHLIELTVTETQHKTTLTVWKGLLSWYESKTAAPKRDLLIRPLQFTISRYLSWDMSDLNILRITKFLAASYLKMIKSTEDIQVNNISLLYQIISVPYEDLSPPSRQFLLMFRHTLVGCTKHTVPNDVVGNHGNTSGNHGNMRMWHVTRLVCALDTGVTSHNVQLVFDSLQHCSLDVAENLHVLLDNDKIYSLIDYTMLRVCGLCTKLPDPAGLEKILVVNLLSYNILCVVVASNTLVFMCRLGGAKYTTSLVNMVTKLVKKVHCSMQKSNLRNVLSRLLPLLSQTSLQSTLSSFASADSGLLDMSRDRDKKSDVCKSVLKQWRCGQIASDRLHGVLLADENVTNLLSELSGILESVSNKRCTEKETSNVYELVIQCVKSVFLHWRSYGNSIIQVLQELEKLLIFEDMLLSSLVADILVRVSGYNAGYQEKLYCTVVVRMWKKLFGLQEPFILQKSIFSLATFARMTPHPGILKALAQDVKIKEHLSGYLRRNVANSTRTKLKIVAHISHIPISDVTDLMSSAHPHPITIKSIQRELRCFTEVPQILKMC